MSEKNDECSLGASFDDFLKGDQDSEEEFVQQNEHSDIDYLDLFIDRTQTFMNSPMKAAIMCTYLTNDISEFVASKSLWQAQLESTSQLVQRKIDEKIDYFLQNCIFIIENQPELNKIVLNSMSNISNITYPKKNSFGERCLLTLVQLYKNNFNLRQSLQQSLIRNVFINLEMKLYQGADVNILRGLISFMEDIQIAGWFTEDMINNFGGWITQIQNVFLDILHGSDVSFTKEDISKIDAVLEFISKCYQDDQFARMISKYVETEGILAIIDQCQQVAMTAEDRKQNNRILVFILDIISRATLSNTKLQNEIQQQDSKYEIVLREDLKNTSQDLQNCEWDFRKSDKVKTYQQTQVMNKKLGGLIKAYSNMLVKQPSIPLPLKNQPGYKLVAQIYKQTKDLDPYIIGCLCHFICVVIKGDYAQKKDGSNFKDFVEAFEQFDALLAALDPDAFHEILSLGQTYTKIIRVNEHDPNSMQNMSIKEVQYAYIGIMKVFHLIKDLANEKKLQKSILSLLGDIQRKQDQNHFHSLILNCLEAPNEELRISVSSYLICIPISKWDLLDLGYMLKTLTYLKTLLSNEMGHESISSLMMIFCKLISNPQLGASKALMESQLADEVVSMALSVLNIVMMHNTHNDKPKTLMKIELAVQCIFLLGKSSLYPSLRSMMFSSNTIQILRDCILAEDHLLKDGSCPCLIEQVCFNISPLLQSMESSDPIKSTGLVAFRTLMQIASILSQKCYGALSQKIKKEQLTKGSEVNQDKLEEEKQKEKEIQILPTDLINKFENEFHDMSIQQWNSWKRFKMGIEISSDLTSSFEVQHTIFSQQNGIGRILAALEPIILNHKTWKLDDFPSLSKMNKIREFFQLLDKDIQMDLMPRREESSVYVYHKHAIHQKLVGFGNYTISPSIIENFNDQFFETIQHKKTTANSFVDLNKVNQNSLLHFMNDKYLQINQKAKIALVTSAFLCCSYISMIYAPDYDMKFSAANQIQHTSKIKGFIMLCASADWCNANVSLKLLKIYRIILKHTLLGQNIERSEEYAELIKVQLMTAPELIKHQSPGKKKVQGGEEDQFYRSYLSLEDRTESAQYIFQMINKVLSDFKEIIECLDYEQLLQQMKLLNGIFKTLQLIFKFYLVIVVFLKKELKLQSEQLPHNIFKMLSFIDVQMQPANLVLELTSCVQKISRVRYKNKLSQNPILEKLFRNIGVVLGQIYTLKRFQMKETLSLVCQKFDSPMTNVILSWSNDNWLADLVAIKLFAEVHPDAPLFSLKIPLMSVEVSIQKQQLLKPEMQNNVIMIIYFDGILFTQLKDIVRNLDWLYTNFTLSHIRILTFSTGKNLIDAKYIDDDDERMETDPQLAEPTNATMEMQFRALEMTKGYFGKDTKEVENEVNYQITYKSPFICAQVMKILKSMLIFEYYKFD